MKPLVLAAALLALAPIAAAAQTGATGTAWNGEQVHTFAIELDPQGRMVSMRPTAPMPDALRSALESRAAEWVFQTDGRPAGSIRSYLRIAVAGGTSAGEPLRILSATTGPAFDTLSNPVYPTSELRRGEGGVVVLQVEVDANGAVTAVDFHGDKQRATRSMANAARDAAWQWRFTPEQVDGMPIASTVLVPVCFMADHPAPSSCSWQGPGARHLSRLAIVTLDPAARVDTQAAQLAGF
ncbi:energy transducer TonB [Marilutibacter spongiae]|uniref:Energy transducer TonB n=1 Tax=Marilutibacter spongiae TaxID=2025720 RepID=A0A7W3TJH1_9GAMM|nr:energy transducer TonB [Lysobacter spongiae]MBB1059493.1 energy transducer TonB [Lysobacter spongiae]